MKGGNARSIEDQTPFLPSSSITEKQNRDNVENNIGSNPLEFSKLTTKPDPSGILPKLKYQSMVNNLDLSSILPLCDVKTRRLKAAHSFLATQKY